MELSAQRTEEVRPNSNFHEPWNGTRRHPGVELLAFRSSNMHFLGRLWVKKKLHFVNSVFFESENGRMTVGAGTPW